MTTRKTKAPSRVSDPEIDALYKRVGRRIGELQDAAGLSQREVCAAIFGNAGLQSEWSRWRRGVQLPNIATLHRIAVYFGVSLAELGLFEPKETLSEMELRQVRELLDRARGILGG